MKKKTPSRKGHFRPLAPSGIQARYFAFLKGIVSFLETQLRRRLFPHLERLTADAAGHVDASHPRRINRVMQQVQEAFDRVYPQKRLERFVKQVAQQTSGHQRAQLGKQIQAALGIPFDNIVDRGLTPRVAQFTAENVSLIRSIPGKMLPDVESRVLEAARTGTRAGDIQDEIEERFGVAESRAALIARDQISKFNGELNATRQQDLGIEKYIWRTVEDERVRGTPGGKWPNGLHYDLDGTEQSWDDPPEINEDGDHGHPGDDYQCVPDGTPLQTDARILRAYRRRYRGELTELTAAEGRTLRTTPNHPVLTQRGWLAAHLVDVGDQLIDIEREIRQDLVEDLHDVNPSAVQLFDALKSTCGSSSASARARGFHGDSLDQQDVEIITVDWGLCVELPSKPSKTFLQEVFAGAYDAKAPLGPFAQAFGGTLAASNHSIGGASQLLALLLSQKGMTHEHRLAMRARLQPLAEHLGAHGCSADAELFRQLFNAETASPAANQRCAVILFRVARWAIVQPARLLASRAQLGAQGVRVTDKSTSHLTDGHSPYQKALGVVEKTRSIFFDGHVVNLETESEQYAADGFIIHNCRCYADPIVDDLLSED